MELRGKSLATIFAVIFTIYFFIFIFKGQPTSYTSQDSLVRSANYFLAAGLSGIIVVVLSLIAIHKK